jgi:sucrose phosphorylase
VVRQTNEGPGIVAPRPQLLTYPDSLGGDLAALTALLEGPLAGLFQGVHILPPFPSSGDRGFSPITYREIDPAFGTWEDIERIAATHDVLLDVMVNHISRRSAEFQDFRRRGRASPFADLFITLDKIWPGGDPPAADVARIFLRKPDAPFSTITIEDTGTEERIWTTFEAAGRVEQIDLDVTSEAGRRLITGWLQDLVSHGVRIVRLDAVGYLVKKAGTSCFMVEPDIYEILDWLTGVAASLGLVLLPEVHDREPTRREMSRRGYWTYDFILPGLLLHAFRTGETDRIAAHLSESPERQFTVLDCHDGIPVRPDLDGILTASEMRALGAQVQEQGGNVNRLLSGVGLDEVDAHQLNCTYYSALGGDDDRYLAGRAIQLFTRGVPQVYYVGLLAGENDLAAVDRTGAGRAINRHDYSPKEVATALTRPVVRRVVDLVRLRATHPAFDGTLAVDAEGSRLRLTWRAGPSRCALEVDLASGRHSIDTEP